MTTTNLPLGIEKTSDYTIFKKLNGNRDVSESRVKKIVQSIENVGYIMNPIIVNENYEIIDGQGRLEALKQLNLPVFYVVEHGAGVNECVTMNAHQTNWNTQDYLDSYVVQGNINYIRFETLRREFPMFDLRSFTNVALCIAGGNVVTSLKNGALTFTEHDMAEARTRLNYIVPFRPYLCKNGGRKDVMCAAIAWAYRYITFDKERLFTKFIANAGVFPPAATIMFALQHFEKIYNQGLTGKSRVYFSNEYDRLRSKR